MKDLARSQTLTRQDRPLVGMRHQVVVMLAEGVADLAQNGAQPPARSWQNQKLIGLKTYPSTRGKVCSQISPSALSIPSRASRPRIQLSSSEPSRGTVIASMRLNRFQRSSENSGPRRASNRS